MKQTNIHKMVPRLAVILSFACIIAACQKELSQENGAFSGTATGELIDSLGFCKNITVAGKYIVDTALNSTNYVTVNINFTAPGKYKVYSDTVNGMWFLDSGFVVSAGQQAIKLKGKGTPILAKQSDFAVFFGNNLCSFSLTATADGTGSGGGGSTGNQDYFPTTAGSSWQYDYFPDLGSVDTFTVTIASGQVQAPNDPLLYYKFGATQLNDTFYFAKNSSGDYYTYSTTDFDYTFVFDSIPNNLISYPFLKPNAAVTDTWETGEYGQVRLDASNGTSERGVSKIKFTVVSKNSASHTVAGKTYNNVINIKRDLMFKPNNGTYRVLLSGNCYYAKGYGMIDQVIGGTPPALSVSVTKEPTIKP